MISQREVERRYSLLMNEVKTNPFYLEVNLDNRVNCYTCDKCGHITKTIDIDPGVTPFMFICEKCNSSALSSFFKDIAPEQTPTFEWYRPSLKQTLKLRRNEYALDHVLSGGLLSRKVKSVIHT